MQKVTGQGMSIPVAVKRLGITDQTFYRWRARYGSLKEDEAKRLQLLEQENARLKRSIVQQALEISMLKDINQGENLSPAHRTLAAAHLVRRYKISERRACQLLEQHRSTQRNEAVSSPEEELLIAAMNKLADLHPRWGYRSITKLL